MPRGNEVKLDRFGRVLIPKPLRTRLGLRPGSRLLLTASDRTLELRPVDEEPLVEERDGLLMYTGRLVGDPLSVTDEIRDERDRQVGAW